MPPAASILIPTRRRRDYLAVALASAAPQAAEHGAELIVVEDDPADPETEAARRRSTARATRPTARPRGLNAARNTAIALAQADLLCFLDDDAEAWPGWLGALLAAAEAEPEHDAFGGPIRARLEGTNLHACGREPPPVTTLDLGPDDRDAEFVWGANLTLRRRALERAGGFDPGLDLYGDEEDWQRRLKAAGGRIRYVAAAGVDHRRTRRRRAHRRPLARRLRARAQLAPLRRAQGRRAAGRGRAAHAGRLPVAHRAPPLRQRDRADRADARAPARGAAARSGSRRRRATPTT